MSEILNKKIDSLDVRVFEDRKAMGHAVVKDITRCILELLETKDCINVMFAAAPSQQEVLEGLRESDLIPWDRVNAFHMDEYIGLDADAPQGFGNFLKRAIFAHVPFKNVYYMDGQGEAAAECERYARILKENPLHICMNGIGENGHLAFNDPPVADFNDPAAVKVVELDQVCRQQQVNDGCFAQLEDVPKTALTVTIPELIRPEHVFCTVPGPLKAPAVQAALTGAVVPGCPASVLRTVNARMYLDKDSGACLL
ncbi:MAG: glucosamine-6-phosphate deaminase [Spirochaetales bacterium]|nr:glucosamine-6-phosphate deaminase [Spirochaetales bacterium]